MGELTSSITRLRALADAACDGQLGDQDIAELEQLLDQNVKLQQFYLTRVFLDTWLHCQFANPMEEQTVSPPSPKIALPSMAWHGTLSYVSSGWPLAYLVATVVCGIGLLAGTFAYVSHPVHYAGGSLPSPSVMKATDNDCVARIIARVDCKWGKNNVPFADDAAVSVGRRVDLESGLLQIRYSTGATVILQGPASYVVDSKNGGYLSIGKLTARLDKRSEVRGQKSESANRKSEIINQIFSIRTPTALVTDLGTEFGVEVDKEGRTFSYVFRGSVRVQKRSADRSETDAGQVLHENQSACVARDRDGAANASRCVDPTVFVREIPNETVRTLDLADVVAGGDGVTERRNAGIDASTGAWGNAPPPRGYFDIDGDRRFHNVPHRPFVDGVFIPDGRTGAVQIDSAGGLFTEFPTTCNRTCGYLWAGGTVPSANSTQILTRLGDVDYASKGHGLLFTHANAGITFDLAAIRRANPGWTPARFLARAGNTGMKPQGEGGTVYADLWVLVDGRVAFRRREINATSGVFAIAAPLGKSDRFLTLAATDSGNGIDYDWIVLGDPRLELARQPGVVTQEPQLD